MKLSKKIIASLLASAMTVSMTTAAATAFADEAAAPASEVKTGDVNGDGDIGMLDVTETQKFIADLVELSNAQKTAADVDAPYGEINLVDVVTVQKYIAELIATFPVDAKSNDSDKDSTDTAPADDTSDSEADTDKATDSQADSEDDANAVLNLKQARDKGTGATITLRGQVVYVYGSNTVILEEIIDGEVVSYQIYDYNGVKAGNYPINAIVEVSGTTSEYNSVLQISKPTDVKTVSENNTAIDPIEATVKDLDNYISTMVIIKNVTYKAGAENNATITDVTGSVNLFKPAELPEEYQDGMTMDIICCPYIFDGKTQIRNSSSADYILSGNYADTETDSNVNSDTNTEADTDTTTDSETDDMETAIQNLEVIIYYIEQYGDNKNDKGYYTEASFNALITLYNEAKAVIASNGENYTVEQVEKLAEDLGGAWIDLEYTALGNLTSLVSAIKKYGDDKNDKGYYTEESYAGFKELYDQAVAYLADTSTLSESEASKLYDDLYDYWNDTLEYTALGLITEVVNTAQYYGDDTNEQGYYTEESYSVFSALYEEALTYLQDPTAYEGDEEKLADDLLEAYNNLRYTRETLLSIVDSYVSTYESYYASAKESGLTDWVAAFDTLKAIQTTPNDYNDDLIIEALETFYELCDALGLFSI